MRTGLLGKAVLVPGGTLTLRLPRALNETIADAIVCGDYRCQEDIALDALQLWSRRRRWELTAYRNACAYLVRGGCGIFTHSGRCNT
jgi:Arc/MetJ-type ribon-helix-helix transcriptional regulator